MEVRQTVNKNVPKYLKQVVRSDLEIPEMTPVVPLKNLQNADQQPYKALETLHWCPEGTVADIWRRGLM